jgi:hypothetical protein
MKAHSSRTRRKAAPMNKRISVWFGLCSALASGILAQPAGKPIRVGPNVLVSRDGDIPHMELMVASNPRSLKNLVGSGITMAEADGRFACKAYSSTDGGNTWMDTSFAEQLEFGGGDPIAAFGSSGTAYFGDLGSAIDRATGKRRGAFYFYRSEDGGKTWNKSIELGPHYDHPQIAVDHTAGPFAGRVYIGVLYGYPVYTVGIFRSEDDGRSFIGPVDAASGKGEKGINVTSVMVLSDGTLVVPYGDFEFKPEKRKLSTGGSIFLVTSNDGGVTFSKPRKAFEQYWGPMSDQLEKFKKSEFASTGFPMLAADTSGGRFRDRIYAVWADKKSGAIRLLFTSSADRGATWAKPRMLFPDAPAASAQYQPTINVNDEGSVGLMWFDTRNSAKRDSYEVYFAASVDGGQTFLPEVKVSSQPSTPRGARNVTLASTSIRPTSKGLSVDFLSAFARWPHGGDYMGLTADSDGVFHPFWADARSGTFQIWSASIRVTAPARAVKAATKPGDSKPEPSPKRASLNEKITVLFDPIRYDEATREATVPIRLKNTSTETLRGPFTVEVKGTESPWMKENGEEEFVSPVEILNAPNGKSGEGAVFDYTAAMRDFEELAPGAVTEAIPWKFRIAGPMQTGLHLDLDVTGFVASTAASR